jgi:hypothetical protein
MNGLESHVTIVMVLIWEFTSASAFTLTIRERKAQQTRFASEVQHFLVLKINAEEESWLGKRRRVGF